MPVLGELRDGLLSGLHPSDAETFGDYFADVFRDFEAAHPGLIDKTVRCYRCKTPTVETNAYQEGRMGAWIWEVCCSTECADARKADANRRPACAKGAE